jgi:hypothetical protein
MGNKYYEHIIDNEKYIFYMLKPRISLSLLTKLIKIIGPGIGKAFPSSIKAKDILETDIDIGSLFHELSNKIDEKEVQEIIDILFSQVMHSGEGELLKGMAYDNLFSGRIKHLLKVVLKALEVQYNDFLAGRDPLEALVEESKKMGLVQQVK